METDRGETSESTLRALFLNQLKLNPIPSIQQEDNTKLLEDDTDFFALGLRSLDVVQIVNRLVHLGFYWADYAIINQNPTLNFLASRLARGREDSAAPPKTPPIDSIKRMIASNSNFVYETVPARESPSLHHVVSVKRY